MAIRQTLSTVARMAQMSSARATVREVEDNHLMQEVKQADVYHGETPTNFERWQHVGMTAVPIKQQEDKNKQQNQQNQTMKGQGDWDHNQPTGPSAEAVMLYLNGQRSHPVAMVDDRRVRPYGMKEGEAAFYDPTGSEQMAFFNKQGAYLVSLNGKSVKDPKANEERFASLRHVNKDMQSHDGEKVEKEKDYKHEGKSVNTEVRCTAGRIEFRAGDEVVGYYEKSSETWFLKGKIAKMEFSEKIEEKAPTISNEVTLRYETVGKTYLGLDSKDEIAPIGETGDVQYKKTYIKLVS